MKILKWAAEKIGINYGPVPQPKFSKRYRQGRTAMGFDAADQGERFQDWKPGVSGINERIRAVLRVIRARSRHLADNNDYMKKYLFMLKNNVIGPKGIKLQMKIKDDNGDLDNEANAQIEEAWDRWGKIESACVTRDQSWLDIQKLALMSLARDGEVLIRKIRAFDNPFKFSLQLIEGDHLDERHEADLSNGNKIRMGVEMDPWGSPVAYHLRTIHPGDNPDRSVHSPLRPVPASEIIHLFLKDRVGQIRGIPWGHSTMVRMHMLGGYEEAELTGARATASKMGFFTREEGASAYTGDDKDADGNMISEFSPGTMEELPPGVGFEAFDPGNPSSNFSDFVKANLRGTASGLNVAYNTLANDLEKVNFSSMRAGVLEERENWRSVQEWVKQHLCDAVFPAWLEMAIVSGELRLPMAKFNKFNRPKWQARGWAYVDPVKDVMANERSVQNRFKAPSACAAEQGLDFEDILAQIQADIKLADAHGIELFINPPASGNLSTEDIIKSEGDNDNKNG